ncbi:efflux RND transporter permease subunit [Shewanella gelidimarina]|uniref:efflux RND transporter permease subunit n=1 Tax=Shewanella gelidimarina TaxID=56813 RepID=UPI00200E620B|nr:efflux RND transporter permease subunit [Shewanella gelidimarina]MCL1057588.1 efflux RND transporter permease subunit [Shewanella gelidimarina]
MLISDTSVERPVIAIVLSILLTLFGIVAFLKLPVTEMPNMVSPIATISTKYKGASAVIVESQVTAKIEAQLTGISGVKDITSVSKNGASSITVEFEAGANINDSVSDIRDAISRAKGSLPDDADEPTVSKDDGTGEPALYINVSSSAMNRTQLTDYVSQNIEDRFNIISGVSAVDVAGGLYKVMFIKLNSEKMAGHKVTTTDILSALRAENLESPAGEIRNNSIVMPVRTERRYDAERDFRYLVIGKSATGVAIYLNQVAEVKLQAESENSSYRSNGVSSVSLAIVPQADANPLELSSRIHAEVDKIQQFLPKGTQVMVDYDATVFIDRSISEVYKTLFMTCALVILVLYLFIGQARATLIPAVTVPVSLIATFIFASYLGFTINLLTLLALILAIGLVVDDAIVVVENIYHHIQQGKPPLLAAFEGTREVGFAVLATTFVLVMVFLPIAMMDGMIGRLFTEFSVMIAVSVMFSTLIALTLTPVLGAKLLTKKQKHNAINTYVERLLGALETRYRQLLLLSLKHRFVAPAIIIACLAGSYFVVTQLSSQLMPQEDRGVIMVKVNGAEGTSFARMSENMQKVETRLMAMLKDGSLKSLSIQTPISGGKNGDQYGLAILQLKDWDLRDENAQTILKKVKQQLAGIPDVRIRPKLPGFKGGSKEPVQIALSGSDYSELNKWAKVMQSKMDESPLMTGSLVDYSEKTPEMVVKVDRRRAAELGISVSEVSDTLNVMLGGKTETTYVENGEEYDVFVRGDEAQFNSSSDLTTIFMRTASGDLVSVDTFCKVNRVASAQKLTHISKRKSIVVRANLAEGATLGEALSSLEQVAITVLPQNISFSYAGDSKVFIENQSSTLIIFVLALLVAYLVMAAQFESFINPFVVMLTVPTGLFGAVLGIWLMGESINIYSQIGIIMLIGMVTKNGILIVEFISQLRDKGASFDDAIIDGASRRLRPIMMTAFTTLAGALPLLLSSGAGAESRVSVGVVVFFGMGFSTLVTLVVIPTMYKLLCRSTQSPGTIKKQLQQLRNSTA